MSENKKVEGRSRYRNRIKNNLLFFVLIALITIVTVVLAINPFKRNWRITSIPSDKVVLEGIDVSNHQGNIKWKDIDQNAVNFAYIKATEGTTFTDKSFSKNWEASKEAGILRGAYHFYKVESDGKKQAEHFISVVPKEKDMLPPVIDIEEIGKNQAKLIVEIREFAEIIEEHYNKKPILYINNQTYDLYARDFLKDYMIWYAIYNDKPPMENWIFWQYTDKGTSKGIEGAVDLNKFNGDRNEILLLTK